MTSQQAFKMYYTLVINLHISSLVHQTITKTQYASPSSHVIALCLRKTIHTTQRLQKSTSTTNNISIFLIVRDVCSSS